MKTAHEVLYENGISISSEENKYVSLDMVLKAMKEYAKLKCKEQRELCHANIEYKTDTEFFEGEPYGVTTAKAASILNAPEPKFD